MWVKTDNDCLEITRFSLPVREVAFYCSPAQGKAWKRNQRVKKSWEWTGNYYLPLWDVVGACIEVFYGSCEEADAAHACLLDAAQKGGSCFIDISGYTR